MPLHKDGALVARAAIVIPSGACALESVAAIVRAATNKAMAATTLLARAAVVRARGARSGGAAGVGEARAAVYHSKLAEHLYPRLKWFTVLVAVAEGVIAVIIGYSLL